MASWYALSLAAFSLFAFSCSRGGNNINNKIGKKKSKDTYEVIAALLTVSAGVQGLVL
jgi:hypothetical protein